MFPKNIFFFARLQKDLYYDFEHEESDKKREADLKQKQARQSELISVNYHSWLTVVITVIESVHDIPVLRSHYDYKYKCPALTQLFPFFTAYVKRVIAHPSFHNIDYKSTIKLMTNMEPGEVVIRPSSKVFQRSSSSWRVYIRSVSTFSCKRGNVFILVCFG